MWKKLYLYASNPSQEIPIVSLQRATFSGNPIYPIIEFIGKPHLNGNFKKLQECKWDEYDFDDMVYDFVHYKCDAFTTKYRIMNWIYNIILNTSLIAKRWIPTSNISNIVNKLGTKDVYLVRVSSADSSCKYLSFCLKPRTNKSPQKSTTIGYKISCHIYVDHQYYSNIPTAKKLVLFSWGYQFKQYLSTKIQYGLGNETAGYYYPVCFRQVGGKQFGITNIKLTKGDNSFTVYGQYTSIIPYIEYDPSTKPIDYIELYKRYKHCCQNHYLPMVKTMYLNVINDEFALKLKHQHLDYIKSDQSYNEYTPNKDHWHRAKTFIYYRYWWNSPHFKQLQREYVKNKDKNKFKLADDQIASGLRFISYECPEYVLNLIKYLKIHWIPQDAKINQIGINLYRYCESDTNYKRTNVSGIESHEESLKFSHVYQLSILCDTVLSFDIKGGSVNGTAGLE